MIIQRTHAVVGSGTELSSFQYAGRTAGSPLSKKGYVSSFKNAMSWYLERVTVFALKTPNKKTHPHSVSVLYKSQTLHSGSRSKQEKTKCATAREVTAP